MASARLVVLADGLAGERVLAEIARRVLGHGRHGLVDAGAALGADLGHDPLRAVVDDAVTRNVSPAGGWTSRMYVW
jgi:hypothetical protein